MTAASSGVPQTKWGGRIRRYAPALFIFLLGLVLWEAAVVLFDIKGFLLPKPSVIGQTYLETQSVIWGAAWVTFRNAIIGLVIGSIIGVVLASATVRWAPVREGLLPFAIAVNSAPIIALAPIFNVWFGSTTAMSKAAVIAVMVFFPVLINMVRGLTDVDASQLELMRSYGASDREIMRSVRVPTSLPYLFNALKIGAVLAMIGAIVAEYFGGPVKALGQFISQRAAGAQFDQAWAAIIVGSLLGIALYSAVALAERFVMPWHVSVRRSEL